MVVSPPNDKPVSCHLWEDYSCHTLIYFHLFIWVSLFIIFLFKKFFAQLFVSLSTVPASSVPLPVLCLCLTISIMVMLEYM